MRYQLELYAPKRGKLGDYPNIGEALASARDILHRMHGFHPDYARDSEGFEFRNPDTQSVIARVVELR
jgi:hypothetical protein